ncbi:MAG TPA: DJ-1/PfpI family protein [Methanosarcina sp.]|nr:DJ-1/PfpI family protein [Methanosarcina sp.]
MSKILMVIPPERFRDEELFVTKEELEKNGHSIVLASTKEGIINGSRGGNAESEITIDKINTEEYDVVVFIGGGGSKLLFNNQDAIRIAQEMNKQQKIVSAICFAPVILANAGILKDKKATVAGTEAKTIEEQGAKYMGPGVQLDGNIITANAPKASRLFGQKINNLLQSKS